MLHRDLYEARSTGLTSSEGNLAVLATLALLVGAVAGLVCALFRLALQRADVFRAAIIDWAHGHSITGFILLVGGCASAAVVAAWLVRRYSPHASGSGIPHVEAVLRGDAAPSPFILLPVKFVGGWLAIGSGLALGREGPSVQMGAVLGHLFGGAFRRDWPDCRVLLAAGAGAGLATAFNAPMAGAVFVLEELVQKFEHRIAIAALAASSTAIAVAHLILGDAPDFHLPPLAYPAPEIGLLFFILGIVCGAVAIAYNKAVLATLAAVDLVRGLPAETCAAAIGAAAGVLAWFGPECVGGGDNLTQNALLGAPALFVLPFLFQLRFWFGALSYSAGTPGGLFAPLLTLGAQLGLLFGAGCGLAFPDLPIQPEAFAVVGVAAFFTGVVRAPLTGLVLATEMTGSALLLLPMLAACFTAMLIPTLMSDAPLYDALRERLRFLR
ncbi:H(+)/Cl(-) exchange transporter ClcA [Methylocystis suflitae]|uniref:H(+)/Cl(-) exchange transporter ClcA n=1 Tax=Methylocystis suflitae TaxID=2951405 RepID=UPI002109A0C1|nr:H(+)/Cl(-) exchange transporter ClcA [Methylocystis suflitae]MCQ4190345.1 H(+)/Cl(-) exchange transporter ClcA [Methylocystis suflitae]